MHIRCSCSCAYLTSVACLAAASVLFLFPGTAKAEEPAQTDERLTKKVTLSEGPLSLEGLLAMASEQTGVSLKADPDSRQWRIRQLPVIVVMKDAPAKELQAHLAKLLDLRWARSGATPSWAYTIWQDANARKREASALERGEQEKFAEATERWTSITDAMSTASAMSAADLEKEAASKPFLKFLTSNDFGKAYGGLLTGIAPTAVPSLAAGETFRAPYASLPRKAQRDVQAFAQSMRWFVSKMANLPESAAPSDWNNVSVVIRPIAAGADQGVLDKLGMVGFMTIDGADVSGPGGMPMRLAFPIVRPDSEIATMIATGASRIASGASPGEVIRDIGSQAGEAARRMADAPPAAQVWAKVGAAAAPDPRMLKEINLKEEAASTLLAALTSISEQTGLPILAEGWSYRDGCKPDKGKALEVIGRLCARLGADWELNSGAVMIRAKDWAARRAAMVSKEEAEYWKSRLDTGGLSLDDLSKVASSYTPDQIAQLSSSDGKLASALADLRNAERRGALSVYAAMNSDQRATARTAEGLSIDTLDAARREALSSAMAAWGINPTDLRLRLTSEGEIVYLKLIESSGREFPIVLKRPARLPGLPQPRNN